METTVDRNRCAAGDQSDAEEDNETITMLDVLQEEQDMEDNAFAVLAGSDDQNCTYVKGYVARQALYACTSCQKTSDEPTAARAAICLACSYRCHDGHELVELYTKRNFRCDCGNDKFVDDCKLCPKKNCLNDNNEYNHNFDGLYCICLRPYPDPDSDVDDSMIQCVVCEDWYHGRHLDNFRDNEEFAEMVCKKCMNRLPFLWSYNKIYTTEVIAKDETQEKNNDIDIISDEQMPKQETRTLSSMTSETESATNDSSDANGCKFERMSGQPPQELAPTYWPMDWRRDLCKCAVCLESYKQNKCLFLTDDKDMVHYYERQSSESKSKESDYDKGLSELNKMNRIQQIEYINGFSDLKESLIEYLRKFAENKKIVREEDIKEFFDQMVSRKRQRVEMPYNCK